MKVNSKATEYRVSQLKEVNTFMKETGREISSLGKVDKFILINQCMKVLSNKINLMEKEFSKPLMEVYTLESFTKEFVKVKEK